MFNLNINVLKARVRPPDNTVCMVMMPFVLQKHWRWEMLSVLVPAAFRQSRFGLMR